MFTLAEELKFYEPGLEVVEDSMSGDETQDMIEIMQAMLTARPDPLAARESKPVAEEEMEPEPQREPELELEEAEEPADTEAQK